MKTLAMWKLNMVIQVMWVEDMTEIRSGYLIRIWNQLAYPITLILISGMNPLIQY